MPGSTLQQDMAVWPGGPGHPGDMHNSGAFTDAVGRVHERFEGCRAVSRVIETGAGADAESAATLVAESDAALVVRAQRGDAEAFGRLVERHMRRAYVHALGLVGSREDALDLSQEAFVRAYRARHTIDPERPFSAWLYRIVRHLCFNFLRDARTRARALETEGAAWLVETARAAAPDPGHALEQAEVRRRLARAIDRLPPHEREVLVLKEFEELKYREIADLVGVPIGTVMSRLYAARRRLADVLEAER